jgi:hypothetical protein
LSEWSDAHEHERNFSDGRVGVVYRITFARARVAVAPYRGSLVYLDEW